MNYYFRKAVILLLFFVIVLLAYFFRTYDFTKEAAKFPSFVPFTLESAMMYSYSWDVAKGTFHKYDESLVGFSKVSVSEQMSMNLEYFLGYGYKIKNFLFGDNNGLAINNFDYEINEDFVNWVRYQLRFWISLTAGFIFIWLLLLDCSIIYASLGGLLFAVAPVAIARATGQDILKENFAIPLIIICFVVYLWYLKWPKNYKLILLACATLLSLISWDMTQLCLALWLVYEIIMTACLNKKEENYLPAWITIYASSIIAGILNPYLAAHNFLQSPALSVLLPVLIFTILFKNSPRLVRILVVLIGLIVFVSIWLFIIKNFGYGSSYSHFWNLLLAKVKFGNIKPLNPLLLDFDSRILWTPALHSATMKIFHALFGLTFICFVIVVFLSFSVSTFRKNIITQLQNIGFPLFLTGTFFILFIFMVRFHVLVIPFICVAIATFMNRISEKITKPALRILLVILFAGLVMNEACRNLRFEREYYSGESEQLSLIKELNSSGVKGETFLADFTLSPMLKAYCGAKIVLIPKFELKQARDRVEKYINILYHGTEVEFMEFCRVYGAKYFIFDKGMIGGRDIEECLHPWSIRYMAAANVLEKTSPVYNFFYSPEEMDYFYELDDQNVSRFVIFKVITPSDISQSEKLYEQALLAYKEGNMVKTKKLTVQALQLNPKNPKTRFLYYTINDGKWPKITIKIINLLTLPTNCLTLQKYEEFNRL